MCANHVLRIKSKCNYTEQTAWATGMSYDNAALLFFKQKPRVCIKLNGLYRHTSLYCTSQMLFLQIEVKTLHSKKVTTGFTVVVRTQARNGAEDACTSKRC